MMRLVPEDVVHCRGGMITREFHGWIISGWNDPFVKLVADNQVATFKPVFGRALRVRRSAVVTVFIESRRFSTLVRFSDGTPGGVHVGFKPANCGWLIAELTQLGWPCAVAPQP